MLYTVLAILIVPWLFGVLASIGGGFIHILLVIVLVAFLYDLFQRHRL